MIASPIQGDQRASFHANLIGLYLLQVQLALVHQRLVNLLAMLTRTISPGPRPSVRPIQTREQ